MRNYIYCIQQPIVSLAILLSLSCNKGIITKEPIERPLPNAEARQLIQAIPNNKVLLTMISPKNLGLNNSDFQQFPTVFYEEDTQEAVLFIPEQALADAQLALQVYSERNSAARGLQLIPLQDLQDFLKIAAKTAPGPGGKNSGCFDIEKREGNTLGYGTSGVNELFDKASKSSHSWSMLCSKDRMRRAACSEVIPYQDLTRDFYQCGVNSAARCLIMMTNASPTKEDYERFRDNCPRTITQIGTRNGAIGTALVSSGLGILLAPFTGGLSALVGHAIAVGAYGVGHAAEHKLPSDVGPTPSDLAEYLSSADLKPPFNLLEDIGKYEFKWFSHAEHCSYSDFWDCAKVIRDDIRSKDPVIVFFIYSPTAMHYESVVGVSVDSNDLPEEFGMMNTNGHIFKLKYPDMQLLMRNDFVTTSFLGGNYNIIRFYRK